MSEFKLNAEKQFEKTSDAVKFYAALGWEPIKLPAGQKKPKSSWKQPRQWTVEELEREFLTVHNIGIALGERSGNLIDIDFDWPEAAEFGRSLLSELPSFGRKSSLYSHRFVSTTLPKGRITFEIPNDAAALFDADRQMVIELRGNGHLTMVPPSLHPELEDVRWHDDPRHIPAMDGEELIKKAGLLAFISVVAKAYPQTPGNRDDICLAITGTLVRAGFDDEIIDTCIELIANYAGDEETDKRTGKVQTARERLEADEELWGLPQLCLQLGIEMLEPTFRKWLSLGGGIEDSRPEIIYLAGRLPMAVDQAEYALIEAGVQIYQRFDALSRVVRLHDGNAEEGVRRANGALVLKEVNSHWLREQYAIYARWVRPKGKDKKKAAIDPPPEAAAAYLARVGEWRVSYLQAITQIPTLRMDGSILQEPGYDERSALLYDPCGEVFAEIPENPTKEEAFNALKFLAEPLRDFQFARPVDKSVALAAVLTALVRRMFPSAPLFIIEAPTAGTGKSLFCETLGIITTGHKPAMMSQGKTSEEQEKRLSSVLLAGDPVIVIDNCERPIEGDLLCSMLTQEWVQPRILGKSEVRRIPTRNLVLATGNNPRVWGDVSRRAFKCRLDARVERPDQLQFDFDPRDEAYANRAKLVVAGLTVIRAYIAAGYPQKLDKIGSFEKWNIIREALVWLGLPDPAETRDQIFDDDDRKDDLMDLLQSWWKVFGEKRLTLSAIANSANEDSSNLKAQVIATLIAKTRYSDFNTRSIGIYLATQVDCIAGGLMLCSEKDSSGVKRYWVTDVEKAAAEKETEEFPF